MRSAATAVARRYSGQVIHGFCQTSLTLEAKANAAMASPETNDELPCVEPVGPPN